MLVLISTHSVLSPWGKNIYIYYLYLNIYIYRSIHLKGLELESRLLSLNIISHYDDLDYTGPYRLTCLNVWFSLWNYLERIMPLLVEGGLSLGSALRFQRSMPFPVSSFSASNLNS